MARTPEGTVKQKITMMLKRYGIKTIVMPATGFGGRKGVCDYLCCVAGKFLAIEAKATAAEKPTALQMDFIQGVLDDGGMAFIVHKDNLHQLETVLCRVTGA